MPRYAFEEFREIIEEGMRNGMPREAKLVVAGNVMYAFSLDRLTPDEQRELLDALGDEGKWSDVLSYAMTGRVLENPYAEAG